MKNKILRELSIIKVRYLNPELAGNPRTMMVDLEERFNMVPDPIKIDLKKWSEALCLTKKN
jgi:hypothetical protein